MAGQYSDGTVSTTAGSNVITGAGTLWLTYGKPGAEIVIGDNPAVYVIGGVLSDTSMWATANLAETVTGETYGLSVDFTTNLGLCKVQTGDTLIPEMVTRALEKLDAAYGPGVAWLSPVIAQQNDPPGSAAVGDRYLVGTVPTSVFVGHANQIAIYNEDSDWDFAAPALHNFVFIVGSNAVKYWTGAAWVTWTVTFQQTYASGALTIPGNFRVQGNYYGRFDGVDANTYYKVSGDAEGYMNFEILGTALTGGARFSSRLDMQFQAGVGVAGQNMLWDCGGDFLWRDQDNIDTEIMRLASATGDLWAKGTCTIDGGLLTLNNGEKASDWSVDSTTGLTTLTSYHGPLWLKAGAGAHSYLDAGGVIYMRDIDATNANRWSLDTATGAMWAQGNITLGVNATASGMDRSITLYSAISGQSAFIGHSGAVAYYTVNGAALTLGCNNTGYGVTLYTGSNGNMFLRLGGLLYFQDADNSNASRMTLNSANGALWIYGSLTMAGLAEAPATVEGKIYYNTTDKHFYGWNGTAWKQLDN